MALAQMLARRGCGPPSPPPDRGIEAVCHNLTTYLCEITGPEVEEQFFKLSHYWRVTTCCLAHPCLSQKMAAPINEHEFFSLAL